MSLRSGEQPWGSGVKWLVRTFSRSKFLRSRGHSAWKRKIQKIVNASHYRGKIVTVRPIVGCEAGQIMPPKEINLDHIGILPNFRLAS